MSMNGLRTYKDAAGVTWRVLRVEPEPVSVVLEQLRQRLSPVARERRRPWLLFESAAGERRRLVPVPDEWDQPGSDRLLADWCAQAEPAPPAPEQRAADKEVLGESE
jgi:hypothetical protein